jgi:flagella basal body P-ring formation protein FlgA
MEKKPHWILLSGIAAALVSLGARAEWQSLESIELAAEKHVTATAKPGGVRSIADADPLDPRLKLPACAGDLQTSVPYGDPRGARITVEVACTGVEAWRIYVPVRLESFGAVVVATRALPRDAVLTLADLSIEERALSRLARGYVAKIEDAVGLKLRRAVPGGAPILPTALASPPLVERGQLVTLQAATGGISVAMTGTALQDGARGAVIDVENGSSGRRVQAIVRSRRVVEVLLQ